MPVRKFYFNLWDECVKPKFVASTKGKEPLQAEQGGSLNSLTTGDGLKTAVTKNKSCILPSCNIYKTRTSF